MYDQLARHEIPWTDQSVKDALAIMAEVVGDSDEHGGRHRGLRSQTDMPDSVGEGVHRSTRRPRWSSSATSLRA